MLINMYGFKNFHDTTNIKKAPAERQGKEREQENKQ